MKETIILALSMLLISSVAFAANYRTQLATAHDIIQQQQFDIEDRDSQLAEYKVYSRLLSELSK